MATEAETTIKANTTNVTSTVATEAETTIKANTTNVTSTVATEAETTIKANTTNVTSTVASTTVKRTPTAGNSSLKHKKKDSGL